MKTITVSSLNLMASKDIREIKITTEDEIIDFDICNEVEIKEKLNTEIKLHCELCSDALIEKIKSVKKAKISFILHCKTFDKGNCYYEKVVYENMTFNCVERAYCYDEFSQFVFVFEEDK